MLESIRKQNKQWKLKVKNRLDLRDLDCIRKENELEKLKLKNKLRLENARKYRKRKQLQETAVQKQDASVIEENRGSINSSENIALFEQNNVNRTINQQDYLKDFDNIRNGSIHEQCWAKENINKFHICHLPLHYL